MFSRHPTPLRGGAPELFGPYELLERINIGGMAEIFRARRRDDGSILAVKRMLPELADEDEFVRMFRDEAKVGAELVHPTIARVLDLGRVEGTYFLALEYINGLDLKGIFDRATRGLGAGPIQLPVGFLLSVFAAVADGLDYAHRKTDGKGRPLGLVHRDVSPHNVLVGFDGDVKLIDFGIAKSAGKLSKTQVGVIKGKYGYLSPEQARGLPLDARSDIFSLGICLHEMLTGRRLFAGDNEILILERIREAKVAAPSSIAPHIPTFVDAVVARALSRDVEGRYVSAAELSVQLRNASHELGETWDRSATAAYMGRTFGPAPATKKDVPTGLTAHGDMRVSEDQLIQRADPREARDLSRLPSVQEQQSMSDNKGSDLDVFESLSSKRPQGTRNSAAPPPPPGRSVPPPPTPVPRRAQTMVGMGVVPPLAPPPVRSAPAPTPPPKANSKPARAGAAVDMDWDDEEEKTHIYDKDVGGQLKSSPPGPSPAAGNPPLPPAAGPGMKSTMVGMGAPLPKAVPPPPGRASERPIPPPSRPPVTKSTMVGMVLSPPAAPPAPTLPKPMAAPVNPLAATAFVPDSRNSAPTNPVAQTNPQTPAALAAVEPPARADATQIIRPKSSGSMGLILGAVGLAAVAGVAAYFYMSSRPGNVVVNVEVKGQKNASVKVSLDGTKKCEESTCRFEGITAGTHKIKASAGDVEKVVDVTIKPGEDAIANITLEVSDGKDPDKKDPDKKDPDKKDPDKKAVEIKTAKLKVSSTQSGIKVEVDGGSAKSLPLDLDSVKPGKHTLKFVGDDKYRSKEIEVTLDEGGSKTVDDVKLLLKVVKAKVAVPKGAKAVLTDGDKKIDVEDGKPVELDTSKTWTLTATAPNMEDYSEKLDKLGEEAEPSVKLEMKEKKAATPVTPPTASPPATAKPVTPPVTPPITPPVTPPAAGGDGSLFINTLPKSNCAVNGTPRGATPITLKVPPGNYTVTCVAKDGDEVLKKTGSATVKGGDTAKVVLKLRD